MEIDLPEVVAEVKAAFDRYEKALGENDVATLNSTFRNDPRTIRYGGTENLYGYAEIEAFRVARAPPGVAHDLKDRDQHATAAITLSLRHCSTAPARPGKVGRQMQTWVRFPEGWRVVAAHVSLIDEPK